MKLNLGSGPDYKEGFVNVDKSVSVRADLCMDIEKIWQFKDDSIDFIYASDVLEHCHDLIAVMNEAWRVLKPGGRMEIIAPHYTHRWAYGDPTHVRYMSEESFYPFSTLCERYRHLFIYCSFKLVVNENIPEDGTENPRQIHVILEK